MKKQIEKTLGVGAGPRACPDFTTGNHKLKGNHRGLPLQKELPEGWTASTIGDTVDILDSQRVPVNAKEREKRKGSIPYYGATGQVGWIDDYLFDEELVLLGEDGAPFLDANKQKAYIIRGKSWVNNHAHVLKAKNGIPNAYIKYYLDIVNYQKFVTGTTRFKLNQSAMRQIPIPIAPPIDQKLIVSEIEKQFSRLDEAVAALKRVRASLKRYKASVLKAAVEGKLTEEWRKNQISDLAQDKKIRDNNLPLGWIWEKVSDLGDVVTGTTPTKARKEYYDSKDYPFFKPTDLNEGYYVKKSEDGLSKKGIEKARLLPTKSILVTCIGATIGKTGLIRVSGAFNQQINAIVPQKNAMPEFVYFVCISPQFKKSIIDNASATTLPILNKRKFEMLTMPMPPLIEQQKIIEEIESHFSVAEEIEEAIDINLKRAERLRQAILKKAFSGKLKI